MIPDMAAGGALVVEVRTRLADRALAEAISVAIVPEGLAACAHVRGPIVSTYRWNAVVETANEVEVDAVTRPGMVGVLLARIEELHPYELPALLVTPAATTDEYRDWVYEQTRGADEPASVHGSNSTPMLRE